MIYYTHVDREDLYLANAFTCHFGTTYEVRMVLLSPCYVVQKKKKKSFSVLRIRGQVFRKIVRSQNGFKFMNWSPLAVIDFPQALDQFWIFVQT